MKHGFLAFLFLGLSLSAAAADNSAKSFESYFQSGIQLAQGSKWEDARAAFDQALRLQPQNSAVLTNLGLAEYNLGQKALAIGLWRRALEMEGDAQAARRALSFALPGLDVRELPHEIRWLDGLHDQFLSSLSLLFLGWLCALCTLALGWSLLSHWGKRRIALADDKVIPAVSFLTVFFGFAWILSLTVTSLKVWDSQLIRGTIVATKVSALSAPEAQAPALFELPGGLEVLVEKSQGSDWLQVTYPGGQTGWVPSSALVLATGPFNLPNRQEVNSK